MLPAPAPAQLDETGIGEQVVTVRVYKGDQVATEGAGVVVGSEGDVLTSAAVLDAGPRATVVAPGAEEQAAVRRLKDKGSGLGVLRAEALRREGLALSVTPLAPGVRVFAVTPGVAPARAVFVAGAAAETAARSVRGGDEVRFLEHNAMIDARAYGSPVIDECGRVVALNVPDPGAFTLFRAPHMLEPDEVVYALSAGEMAPRLRALGVAFATVTEPCVSAVVQAQEQAREAEAEVQEAQARSAEARQRAEELEERARQAEADAEASEQEREEARAAAERAQREAEAARADAEEAERQALEAREREEAERRRSERLRQLAVWGGAAGGVLVLLLLVAWALSARRKRRAVRAAQARAAEAEQEAAQARERVDALPEPAPFDCVLAGRDGSDVPLALNVPRDALGAPAGVIVGRDPMRSSHVVADPSVSREHVRLYVEGGMLHVEDLESTNGTSLNGQRLAPRRGAPAGNGDALALGSVTFRIELRA